MRRLHLRYASWCLRFGNIFITHVGRMLLTTLGRLWLILRNGCGHLIRGRMWLILRNGCGHLILLMSIGNLWGLLNYHNP